MEEIMVFEVTTGEVAKGPKRAVLKWADIFRNTTEGLKFIQVQDITSQDITAENSLKVVKKRTGQIYYAIRFIDVIVLRNEFMGTSIEFNDLQLHYFKVLGEI
jgi:ketosteroid isomerase-like protein